MAVLLAGCVQTMAFKSLGKTDGPLRAGKVLMLPPDVELSELTASGLLEPKAEWTSAAKGHLQTAIGDFLGRRNSRLVAYRPPMDDPEMMREYGQLLKLHEVVGLSILLHQYEGPLKLPTKVDNFQWELGDTVTRLREATGSDYALFVFVRDSYTSAGRAMFIFAGALLGVGIPGGLQLGFASLVDLRTGEVVWFNRLVSESGDLRTLEPAHEAVANLLNEIPL